VLTQKEVRQLLNCLEGTSWLRTMLLYGSGLRRMKCCRLRVKGRDCCRNQIVIHSGKESTARPTG
jgi:hypothetical protein